MKYTNLADTVSFLSHTIRELKTDGSRFILAIAGPPASGKSTLAEALVEHLNALAHKDASAVLLPMDGFHLDNCILEERGLLERKGAPETFDADGLLSLLDSLRDSTRDIYFPTFDRTRDLAIAGSGVVSKATSIVVVEGNYLLLNSEPWQAMLRHFDHTVLIRPPLELLEQRLLDRWLGHGLERSVAEKRVENNDLVNTRVVLEQSVAADNCFK